MSWAIGYDSNWKRDIGYGVPALCDHPDCDEKIDRGLSYVCGGEAYGGEVGCGLFFCAKHRTGWRGNHQVCSRCSNYKKPYKPKPDIPEWIIWKLTDSSWAAWRAEHPEFVEKYPMGETKPDYSCHIITQSPEPWPMIWAVRSDHTNIAFFNKSAAERFIGERKRPELYRIIEYVPAAAPPQPLAETLRSEVFRAIDKELHRWAEHCKRNGVLPAETIIGGDNCLQHALTDASLSALRSEKV